MESLKDLMLDYLREEGFKPKETEYGFDFRAEGKNFIFLHDENDKQFFRLLMPGIYDVTEENTPEVLKAMNAVNKNIKVVKAYTMFPDSVWLAFEILADSTPVMADIVPRAISMLKAGQNSFYEAIQNG